MFLRQSTTQTVRFGPMLDITDGVTEETALTLAQADMRLSKDGGAFAQKNASGNATHDSDGWYSTSLNATDTNTVGELLLNVHQPANTLPVWVRWWVIEEAVYDAIYGAAAEGPLQPTVAGRTLDITAAGEAGIDLDNTVGTLDAAQIGTDAITAAKIAANAIGASELAADAIGASQFATDAVDEIAAAVWDRLLTGGTHNISTSAGRRLRSIEEFQGYELGAIWIDTLNGTAGTVNFENGTVENPVLTLADALTISASVGLTRFELINGSSITLTANSDNYTFKGTNWTLALGGQSIDGATIEGATVTGVSAGSNAIFRACEVGTATIGPCTMHNTQFTGTLTALASGTYFFVNGGNGVGGLGAAIFDSGSAIANVNLHAVNWGGALELQNFGQSGTDVCMADGTGRLIVNVNSIGGTLTYRGSWQLSDSGAMTVENLDDNTTTIAALQVDTDDIQTRLPAALVGGAMDADVSNMQANTVNAAALATDAVDEIRDAILPVLNATFSNIPVFMALSSDHVSAATGLTLGVTRSIDGGAFGAGTGTAAEIANGMYQYDASAADMNGTMIAFRFTGTAADDTIVVVRTGG